MSSPIRLSTRRQTSTVFAPERFWTIIIIAHCEIKNFQDPTSESYDRYQIKVHKSAAALVEEWADCVLFALDIDRIDAAIWDDGPPHRQTWRAPSWTFADGSGRTRLV